MFDVVVTTSFEDVQETADVAVDVRVRVNERVSDSCLGSKVHDSIELLLNKKALNPFSVLKIEAHGLEVGIQGDLLEPCKLEIDVIVVIDIIEAHYRISSCEEPL